MLLRLLLREAVSAAPDDDGLMEARACRELLAGAELYEVAGLDAEWPQAAASLLLGLLTLRAHMSGKMCQGRQ